MMAKKNKLIADVKVFYDEKDTDLNKEDGLNPSLHYIVDFDKYPNEAVELNVDDKTGKCDISIGGVFIEFPLEKLIIKERGIQVKIWEDGE